MASRNREPPQGLHAPLMRALPSVDECLKAAARDDALRELGRNYLRNLARQAQSRFRQAIVSGSVEGGSSRERIVAAIVNEMRVLAQDDRPVLQPVVNATGSSCTPTSAGHCWPRLRLKLP
jgi:hypothetical protein